VALYCLRRGFAVTLVERDPPARASCFAVRSLHHVELGRTAPRHASCHRDHKPHGQPRVARREAAHEGNHPQDSGRAHLSGISRLHAM